MAHNWFHAAQGRSEGPFLTAQMLALIAEGAIRPQTLVWRSGLANWEPASAHFDFATTSALRPGAEAGTDPSTPPLALEEPTAPAGADTDWIARLRVPTPGAGSAPAESTARPAQPRANAGPDGLYLGAPYRSFPEAIRVCLSNYFTFKGRASRSEYWWFYLAFVLAGNILPLVFMMLALVLGPWIVVLFTIAYLAMIPPLIAVQVRRLHDVGRSGWWLGAPIIVMPVLTILGVTAAAVADGLGRDASEAAPTLTMAVIALIGVIGLAYGILMLVFSVRRGDPGPNRFG